MTRDVYSFGVAGSWDFLSIVAATRNGAQAVMQKNKKRHSLGIWNSPPLHPSTPLFSCSLQHTWSKWLSHGSASWTEASTSWSPRASSLSLPPKSDLLLTPVQMFSQNLCFISCFFFLKKRWRHCCAAAALHWWPELLWPSDPWSKSCSRCFSQASVMSAAYNVYLQFHQWCYIQLLDIFFFLCCIINRAENIPKHTQNQKKRYFKWEMVHLNIPMLT